MDNGFVVLVKIVQSIGYITKDWKNFKFSTKIIVLVCITEIGVKEFKHKQKCVSQLFNPFIKHSSNESDKIWMLNGSHYPGLPFEFVHDMLLSEDFSVDLLHSHYLSLEVSL